MGTDIIAAAYLIITAGTMGGGPAVVPYASYEKCQDAAMEVEALRTPFGGVHLSAACVHGSK